MGRSVQSFSYLGSDLRRYFPGATAWSLRTGLVTPFASRAVTTTAAPGFGAAGSWRTLLIAAGAAPASGDRARATMRENRADRAVLTGSPPAEVGGRPGSFADTRAF